MNKLVIVSALAALMLTSMSVQADHRDYDRHGKHWNKHHQVYKFDGHRHKHVHKYKRHGNNFRRARYGAFPHRHSHFYSHYDSPRYYDDGGHWGIVFRYFD